MKSGEGRSGRTFPCGGRLIFGNVRHAFMEVAHSSRWGVNGPYFVEVAPSWKWGVNGHASVEVAHSRIWTFFCGSGVPMDLLSWK